MAAGLTPSIIVLALGAGALGFPDALRLLLLRDVAGRRSPLLDIAVCTVAMAALTAYALGAVLLVRFVRKAGPGAGAGGARRTDPFARLTHAVSLGAAAAVFAIIVLALGAGALGFPDALRLLLLLLRDVAGARNPPLDIAVCAVAMAALTAYALGAVLLARFVRKAGPGAGGHAPAPRARRTDPFARLTLAVSLGAAGLVFACLLLAAPGARGLGMLCRRIVHDVAGESEPSHVVVSVLVAIAAVLVPCCITTRRLLLRGFRGEDGAHGAAPASSPAARLSATITTRSAAAAAFLLAAVVSGGLYSRRAGSLASVSVAVAAAVVGASMVLSRFTRNAAHAGGRAALGPATNTRRFQAPSQLAVVVSFASLVVCLLVAVTTYATATHERKATGAEY
ncbi:hypothetical protein U9M48_029416 [Paspalum notatum var. saurae]|uniref:Uncharacterized protein n=1 Tax=Paspalum notatum var. saurae TaxID=547442 RepID=A0AAQ3U2X5_PASNO